jgi:hypothetical protein
MNVETIRKRLHQRPFRPFKLKTSNGEEVVVPHPDFVALSARQVIVIREDESVVEIDPLHVVALDTAPPAALSPAGTGQTGENEGDGR